MVLIIIIKLEEERSPEILFPQTFSENDILSHNHTGDMIVAKVPLQFNFNYSFIILL